MRNRSILLVAVVALTFLSATAAGGQVLTETPRILIIDESDSFEVSMRVQGLVGGIRSREEVDLDVVAKMVEVEHPTENPVKFEVGEPFDGVIIIPGTISSGKINQVWIVTRPFSTIPVRMRPEVSSMMEQLKLGINEAFAGRAEGVGVNDDVIPAYFSTLFLKEGVLR
ncbi:MAG: hypothetical protein ACLFVS_03610 [Candidatus Acetothermia bacterium]